MPASKVSRSIQASAEQAAQGDPIRSTDRLNLYPFPPGKFSHLAVWLWKKGREGKQPVEISFEVTIGNRTGYVLARESALTQIPQEPT